MPRGIKSDAVDVAEKEGRGTIVVGSIKMTAWDGDHKTLAPAKFKEKNGKVVLEKAGEPQYFLRRFEKRYEVIKVYRKHNGIATRITMTLRDDSRKHPGQVSLIKKLRAAGFQVLN
jgi:hypothetical protein